MANDKALIVIDMQNDYLWDKRKPMFSYNTQELVKSVNSAVSHYKENGYERRTKKRTQRDGGNGAAGEIHFCFLCCNDRR